MRLTIIIFNFGYLCGVWQKKGDEELVSHHQIR